MLRVVILAMVVVIAIGMMIPVATEHAEAGAKEQERQYLKKDRAEKFKYRTRFRTASYSKSERFIQTAKLRETESDPVIPVPVVEEVAPPPTATAMVKGMKKVRTAKKARSAVAARKTRRAKRAKSASRPYVRYEKVSRYRASGARKISNGSSSRRREVKRSSRKYTARWWHTYREQKREEEALAKRKAAMAARREALQRQHAASDAYGFVEQAEAQPTESGLETLTQMVMNSDGTVSLVEVGPAIGETMNVGRRSLLGGISTTALRRTVIDQMIRENGWVENDFQKQVDGKTVYVVVAKAPDAKNGVRLKTFYFTEAKGKIYRVSASAPKDAPEQAAEKSEEMIKTLDGSKKPQQAKAKLEEEPERPRQAKAKLEDEEPAPEQ